MNAGLNLFSLRTKIQTEADFLTTALKLKQMGYDYLQYSGGPYDADTITRVSKETGLPVVLTHVPMERILGNTEALMEEHARFGCKNIGLGAMPPAIIMDGTLCRKTVEKLNRAGETMQKNGFQFFYHHHHFELYKHDGQPVLDYMIEHAPFIRFTLDTYWLQYGGADIMDTIEKLHGRIGCVHLKDYKIEGRQTDTQTTFTPVFAPVGDGTLPFGEIIKAMRAAGTEYFLVEQDNAVDFPDPFGQVERSIHYLKKEF